MKKNLRALISPRNDIGKVEYMPRQPNNGGCQNQQQNQPGNYFIGRNFHISTP
jgi:hypothetical protein